MRAVFIAAVFLVGACGGRTTEYAATQGSAHGAGGADPGVSTGGSLGTTPPNGTAFVDPECGPVPANSCGLNGRGTLNTFCKDRVWRLTKECVDPDECADGDRRRGITMCGASRTQLQSCNQGVWEDLPQACLQDCTGDLRFDDPLVERAVRVELGIVDGQPIPQASAKQVRKLVMGESLDPSERTGSLGGVECLTGLEALGVLGSAVTDLAPLAPLGNLKEIWLEGPEELTDLSMISHLRSLVLVHVRYAGVTDVMPLTKLTGLVNVGVPGNQIRDLQPLLLLSSLAAVDLEYNPVDCSDPTQQAALRELRRVAGVNQAGMTFEDVSYFGGGPGPSFWSPCPASDSP